MIKVVFVAVATASLLSGCARFGTEVEPNVVGENSSYAIDSVRLPDGRIVDCLWYNKGGQSGSMSCDWENVK